MFDLSAEHFTPAEGLILVISVGSSDGASAHVRELYEAIALRVSEPDTLYFTVSDMASKVSCQLVRNSLSPEPSMMMRAFSNKPASNFSIDLMKKE